MTTDVLTVIYVTRYTARLLVNVLSVNVFHSPPHQARHYFRVEVQFWNYLTIHKKKANKSCKHSKNIRRKIFTEKITVL